MISGAIGIGGGLDCTPSPPTLTNDSGLGCWITPPSSFVDVRTEVYWSSSAELDAPSCAYQIDLGSASYTATQKSSGTGFVWPVRGGQ